MFFPHSVNAYKVQQSLLRQSPLRGRSPRALAGPQKREHDRLLTSNRPPRPPPRLGPSKVQVSIEVQSFTSDIQTVGDQEELSVGTPASSSIVTAVSGNDGEVVGRRSIRTGETRRWRTLTVRKNYDHTLLSRMTERLPSNDYHQRSAALPS
ncbi:hypothetical protein EVAR_9892_1 [Eumeta japonica]|uniref:Uncharacterized protein n=1 Tax=Eumeta variegata TaxID=151549 RepID=A0A4C1TQD2_EUMVA|nr:hypothetical protein EVAR_9892_1 [Eumeta japonica]